MTKRLASILVLAFGLASLPASGAGAASSFTWFGSGYGHGIGVSQYGTLGFAQAGWGADKILKHYYHGVKVPKKTPPTALIKIGLLQYRSSTKLVAASGSFELKLKSGTHVDSVKPGQSRTITIVDGKYRVKRGNGEVVGDLWGGDQNHLLAVRNGDARISVPEWGHQIAHGKVQFDIVGNASAHVRAVMKVEHYLFGISEVPSLWPFPALRAQAILARSYAYWRLAGPPRSGCSCDVLTTPADQAYTGWSKESGTGGNRWVSSVKKTNQKVVTHQGDYVYTPYSSSSGGHTEDIQKVWPGAAPAPHLDGVCDPRDDNAANPNVTWSVTYSASTVTSNLKPYTGDIGTVTKFKDYNRGESGRVTTVRVVGTQGSTVVEGWDIRSAMGLKDTRFSVNKNLNITGRIRTKYDKENCKPGRATGSKKGIQGGAYQRFLKGRIYVNDAADKVVWVRGAVLDKYLSVGGHGGKLGLPVSFTKVPGGHKGVFDGGIIVCTSGCTVTYD